MKFIQICTREIGIINRIYIEKIKGYGLIIESVAEGRLEHGRGLRLMKIMAQDKVNVMFMQSIDS